MLVPSHIFVYCYCLYNTDYPGVFYSTAMPLRQKHIVSKPVAGQHSNKSCNFTGLHVIRLSAPKPIFMFKTFSTAPVYTLLGMDKLFWTLIRNFLWTGMFCVLCEMLKSFRLMANVITLFHSNNAGRCITTANCRSRSPFSQWQHSFRWKLRSHPLAKSLATV